jgi:hypothetical protein
MPAVVPDLPSQASLIIPPTPGTGGGLPSLSHRVWKISNYSIHHRRTDDGNQVTKQTTRHLTLWVEFVAEDFNDVGFATIRDWEYLPATERLSVGAGGGNVEYFIVTANTWKVESLDVQIEGPKGILTGQFIVVEQPVLEDFIA